MKHLLLMTALTLAFALIGTAHAADKAAKAKGKKLQHVVAFKFKASATPEQIQDMEKEFRALKDKIPGIVAFEAGVNNSPEGKNHGFTNCYILTFKNEKDRDAYLPHPAHKAFGKIAGPLLEDVFVVDFWAE